MIRQIASLDNHHVKLAASLKQKKFRDETGLFVVEGFRFIRELLSSAWTIEYSMISDVDLENGDSKELIIELEKRGCPVFSLSTSLMRKVSDTENPQGIVAVVRQKQDAIDDLPPMEQFSPWVVLDSVQDPGNVGTIIRTADAAGAAGVILVSDCADLYSGKTARATMGSLFHIPVYKATVKQCLSFCAKQNLSIYVTGAEATDCYYEIDLTGSCAIVLGNEGAGVCPGFRQKAKQTVRIPLAGQAESLNVASAAAVILFEAVRQKRLNLC